MRYIRLICQLLAYLLVIALGLSLLLMPFERNEATVDRVLHFMDAAKIGRSREFLAVAVVGAAMVFVGVAGLILPGKKRRKNTLTFPAEHGDIVVQLDPIENTLNRLTTKMPQVRKANVRIIPEKTGRQVRLAADVVLYRREALRDTMGTVKGYIRQAAMDSLGADVVTDVTLNVRGIIAETTPPPKEPKKKTVKPEPVQEPPEDDEEALFGALNSGQSEIEDDSESSYEPLPLQPLDGDPLPSPDEGPGLMLMPDDDEPSDEDKE